MAFVTSDNGVDFLKSQEGCVLKAYKLEGETYYTIGYGHYGADVTEGMTITEAEAEALLREDLVYFEEGVNTIAVSKFPSMNQNQFDALISYSYNRGLGNSAGTNGLRQLIFNSDSLEEVGTNFVVYWGSAESYKDSLIARREREQALFNTPVASDVIDEAVDWAVGIANDDTHGYDQNSRWGLDYDCSSLIIQAWENAGVPVKTNGASYTGNMKGVFKKYGFEDVTSEVNLETGEGLQKGDVVWKSGHVEMCSSSGYLVGAHINELGKVVGGQTGDQTGREINVRTYYNAPWTTVLRYTKGGSSGSGSSSSVVSPTKPKKKHMSLMLMYMTTR